MTMCLRAVVLAAISGVSGAGCASVLVSSDATLVVTGHVYDDPAQAVPVTFDSDHALPPTSGAPVPGCEVALARRLATSPGATVLAASDRTDAEGHFSVFGGREPGPYQVVLTVECPGASPIEHTFDYREPRRYRAAVFVARTR